MPFAQELPRVMPGGPLSESEAARVLQAALWEQGVEPTRELLEILLAQLWFEGNRGRSMWQHNWGNISASPRSWSGAVWRPPWYRVSDNTSEQLQTLYQKMLRGEAPEAFRAYASHEAGAEAYVKLLSAERFTPLLNAARVGDIKRFADSVRSTGYCPDCPESFASTLLQLIEEFRTRGVFQHVRGFAEFAGAALTTRGYGGSASAQDSLATGAALSVIAGVLGAIGFSALLKGGRRA